MTRPVSPSLKNARIDPETAGEMRREIDAAIVPISRKYGVSVAYLLRLGTVGGSAL
jgi:hypothetical protein